MTDAYFERSQPPSARITAFRKDQDDAPSFEYLVHGSQPRLVELSPLGRDRKDSDEREKAALPFSVEHRFSFRHRVDDRRLGEERDDERRVEPGLVVRGDDVRRGGNVLEASHRDAKQHTHKPPDDAAYKAIETCRVEAGRVG